MNYRDSSIATHYTRGIIAGAESSHGVKIEGGSTGGVVEAVGDDTDITLNVRGKGAGGVVVGASSGTALTGIFLHTVQYTSPAIEASSFTAHSTITVAGLTTNAGLVFTPRTDVWAAGSTLARAVIVPFCSTAGELKLMFYNQTGSTMSAQSTSRGVLTEFRR